MKKGLLIVFEGIDGAGKTTQAFRVRDMLRERGFIAEYTKEPTNSPYGQEIRRIAEQGREHLSPEEELDLFIKDREIDVRENILPVLERGGVVIVDRYYYSNIAYQGALGLDPVKIKEVNAHFPHPDRVLLFDLSPEASIQRIRHGRGEDNNLGYEQQGFLTRVREVYHAMTDPAIRIVDASHGPDDVSRQVDELIDETLQNWAPTLSALSPKE